MRKSKPQLVLHRCAPPLSPGYQEVLQFIDDSMVQRLGGLDLTDGGGFEDAREITGVNFDGRLEEQDREGFLESIGQAVEQGSVTAAEADELLRGFDSGELISVRFEEMPEPRNDGLESDRGEEVPDPDAEILDMPLAEVGEDGFIRVVNDSALNAAGSLRQYVLNRNIQAANQLVSTPEEEEGGPARQGAGDQGEEGDEGADDHDEVELVDADDERRLWESVKITLRGRNIQENVLTVLENAFVEVGIELLCEILRTSLADSGTEGRLAELLRLALDKLNDGLEMERQY